MIPRAVVDFQGAPERRTTEKQGEDKTHGDSPPARAGPAGLQLPVQLERSYQRPTRQCSDDHSAEGSTGPVARWSGVGVGIADIPVGLQAQYILVALPGPAIDQLNCATRADSNLQSLVRY